MAPVISQLKNKSNCRTLMRREFSSIVVRKVEVLVSMTVPQLPLTSDPTENRKQTKILRFSKVSILL